MSINTEFFKLDRAQKDLEAQNKLITQLEEQVKRLQNRNFLLSMMLYTLAPDLYRRFSSGEAQQTFRKELGEFRLLAGQDPSEMAQA